VAIKTCDHDLPAWKTGQCVECALANLRKKGDYAQANKLESFVTFFRMLKFGRAEIAPTKQLSELFGLEFYSGDVVEVNGREVDRANVAGVRHRDGRDPKCSKVRWRVSDDKCQNCEDVASEAEFAAERAHRAAERAERQRDEAIRLDDEKYDQQMRREREYTKAWRKANPDAVAVHNANYRAKKIANDPGFLERERLRARENYARRKALKQQQESERHSG